MEYGLIGEKLGHSYSKDIHNWIGNYEYEIKEIAKENLNSFMTEKNFKAINVTIPYKQDVIPFLDSIDEHAKKIGAVNTIVNKNGKLFGYNTDFIGLRTLIVNAGANLEGKKVLILGTGGTSKTATEVAASLNAGQVLIVSRREGENCITYDDAVKNHNDAQIIINTTPCGMFPKANDMPIDLQPFEKLEAVFDAIYNPLRSNLVLAAEKKGLIAKGGLFMLVQQAIAAAEFFFECKIENTKSQEIFNRMIKQKQNIVLSGMPGCGKSSVGKKIAKKLGRNFFDTDDLIKEKAGCEIAQLIETKGEKYFRDLESLVIEEVSSITNAVISTGGGAILREENVVSLKRNGLIYFIDRDIKNIKATDDRPLSNSREKLEKLYEQRLPIYKASCDFMIKSDENIFHTIEVIQKDFVFKNNLAVVEKSLADGEVVAPPSKSMAHRSLICAALAKGKSLVHNIDLSEDIKATINCLKELGANVEVENRTAFVEGAGESLGKLEKSKCFRCNESGSTLRFFVPLSMLDQNESTFIGSDVLMTRPMSVYEEICKKQGILFEKEVQNENGRTVLKSKGKLQSGTYNVQGNISSQFITGLLFTLPLLDGDSTIEISEPIESKSYINMTLKALKDFGVEVEWKNENTLFVKGNQQYKCCEVSVEGDFSNAAFFEVLNYAGGKVAISGLDENSLQGDKVYKSLFAQIKNGFSSIDISDCPDLGPILFVVAAMFDGAEFTGTKRLKIKESDRGQVMCDELAKFGVQSKIEENTITIYKSELKSPFEILCGHNDHRIVMSLVTLLTKTGGKIQGIEAVNKSFPNYFECLESVKIKVKK